MQININKELWGRELLGRLLLKLNNNNNNNINSQFQNIPVKYVITQCNIQLYLRIIFLVEYNNNIKN